MSQYQGPQDPNQPQGPQPGPAQPQPQPQPVQPYHDPRMAQPPHGGATTFAPQLPQKKKRRVWLWVLLGILALSLVIIVACSAATIGAVNSALESAAPVPTATTDEPAADSTEPAADPTEEASEEPAPEPTKKALSKDKRNAVAKAESYLEFAAFSKKGLIKQLKYEGFKTKDAEFAASYIDADWKEQAALKAESYLELQSFSRSGLEKQLKFEGFTDDQAKYGVKKAYK